ncbi:MAG: hypothetical protein EBV21_13700 [Betaproteobacteria bacterium]|nr:hypothetical protein [Betaproteobacteria bacterium]
MAGQHRGCGRSAPGWPADQRPRGEGEVRRRHCLGTFYWQQLLDDGVVASGSDIARREGLHHSTVNELLRLTLLEPAIIQVILTW